MRPHLLFALTFAAAGCTDPFEAYRDVLDQPWWAAGEGCSPSRSGLLFGIGNDTIDSGVGHGSVLDCYIEECLTTLDFTWRLDEDGLLTIEHDYDGDLGLYINNCGLPENEEDVQQITENTQVITLRGVPFTP